MLIIPNILVFQTVRDFSRSISRELQQPLVGSRDVLLGPSKDLLGPSKDPLPHFYQSSGGPARPQAIGAPTRQHKYQKHVSGAGAVGSGAGETPWRSTGRLIVSSSNRSMPRLNGGEGSNFFFFFFFFYLFIFFF